MITFNATGGFELDEELTSLVTGAGNFIVEVESPVAVPFYNFYPSPGVGTGNLDGTPVYGYIPAGEVNGLCYRGQTYGNSHDLSSPPGTNAGCGLAGAPNNAACFNNFSC